MASISLLHQLEDLAKTNKIPLQVGATGGGTDGAAMQRSNLGAKMMALSIPIRYLHSTVELAHLGDLKHLITLTEKASLGLE